MKIKLTHKGWFGLCPCYFADLGTDSPYVEPRHWLLTPLVPISAWIFQLMSFLASLANFETAGFPLTITEELAEPREIEVI